VEVEEAVTHTKEEIVKVVVTTIHRGVFFGELVEEKDDVVKLSGARNCVYWPVETRGFLGLAATGPGNGSKVGPAAPSITLRGVTSISECTPEAAAAWESGPWHAPPLANGK
jgi:hypothetical protein